MSRPPRTLRPYQQIGLDWLQFLREYGLAGILADDMGLGKTVQTLAHMHLEKTSGRADRPSLVVATTSLMANWRDEAAQFTPDLNVLILHGKDRAERFGEIAAADLVLTTYPLLVRDRETLLAQDWHLLVMDEAQFIKNPKAQAHQVARSLRAASPRRAMYCRCTRTIAPAAISAWTPARWTPSLRARTSSSPLPIAARLPSSSSSRSVPSAHSG